MKRFVERSRDFSFVSFAKDGGNVPFRRFALTLRDVNSVKLPNASGSVELKEFAFKFMDCSCVKRPILDGIGPVSRELVVIDKVVIFVRPAKALSGKDPTKFLFERLIEVTVEPLVYNVAL